MMAVVAPQPDGAEELALVERPVPRAGPGEVLIKVAAAGVNRPDILQRRGLYPPPPGAPDILGLEIAGEVVEAGEGAEAADRPEGLRAGRGRRLCRILRRAGRHLPARARQRSRWSRRRRCPRRLFTVWVNLFERGFAADGDWVLVHGGTSGIGTMAIALGKLFGLNVIVTCGSDEKCARALELGADAAINYRTQDFVEEVQRADRRQGRRRRARHGRRRLSAAQPRMRWPRKAATSRSRSSAERRPRSRSPTSCGGG